MSVLFLVESTLVRTEDETVPPFLPGPEAFTARDAFSRTARTTVSVDLPTLARLAEIVGAVSPEWCAAFLAGVESGKAAAEAVTRATAHA
jgi:hypothetical protein